MRGSKVALRFSRSEAETPADSDEDVKLSLENALLDEWSKSEKKASSRRNTETNEHQRFVGRKRNAEFEATDRAHVDDSRSPRLSSNLAGVMDGDDSLHYPESTVGVSPPGVAAHGGGAPTVPRCITPPSTGKKVPAPGATKEAIARLSKLKCFASPPPASRKLPAPGATQAAIARLAQATSMPEAMDGDIDGKHEPKVRSTILTVPPGSVIWAKMPSYPWWPAQVQQPNPEQLKLKHGPSDAFVVFYGSADYAWLPKVDTRPFRKDDPEYARFAGIRNKGLQRALDEAWLHLGEERPDLWG